MKNEFLNDEEAAILLQIESLTKEEKIKLLEESCEEEPDESNRRTLRSLILRLKEA